jgi:hypothetical protein
MRNKIDTSRWLSGFAGIGTRILNRFAHERIFPEDLKELEQEMFLLYFPKGAEEFDRIIGERVIWFPNTIEFRPSQPILCTISHTLRHERGYAEVLIWPSEGSHGEMIWVPLSNLRKPSNPEFLVAELCMQMMDGLPTPLPRFKGIASWSVRGFQGDAKVQITFSKGGDLAPVPSCEATIGFPGDEGEFGFEVTPDPFPWLLLLSLLELSRAERPKIKKRNRGNMKITDAFKARLKAEAKAFIDQNAGLYGPEREVEYHCQEAMRRLIDDVTGPSGSIDEIRSLLPNIETKMHGINETAMLEKARCFREYLFHEIIDMRHRLINGLQDDEAEELNL